MEVAEVAVGDVELAEAAGASAGAAGGAEAAGAAAAEAAKVEVAEVTAESEVGEPAVESKVEEAAPATEAHGECAASEETAEEHEEGAVVPAAEERMKSQRQRKAPKPYHPPLPGTGGYDTSGKDKMLAAAAAAAAMVASEGACVTCGVDDNDGLICDGCFAVFHQTCVGLLDVPEGDWQGLTLVHFSAPSKPFVSLKPANSA